MRKNIVFAMLFFCSWTILLYIGLISEEFSIRRYSRYFQINEDAPLFEISVDTNDRLRIIKTKETRCYYNHIQTGDNLIWVAGENYIDLDRTFLFEESRESIPMTKEKMIEWMKTYSSAANEGSDIKVTCSKDKGQNLGVVYEISGKYYGEIATYSTHGDNVCKIPKNWTSFEETTEKRILQIREMLKAIIISLMLVLGLILIGFVKNKKRILLVLYISIVTLVLIAYTVLRFWSVQQ